MKIVINACYGGFGLSHKAVMRYAELKGIKVYGWVDDILRKHDGGDVDLNDPKLLLHYCTTPIKDDADYKAKIEKHGTKIYFHTDNIPRDDPALIQTVEELGDEASDRFANLKIIEIPDGTPWEIDEYDGTEWVAESHRRWS